MASTGSDFKPSSKWMYALLFSAPVAAYIGYRLMKTNDTPPPDKTPIDSESSTAKGTSNGDSTPVKESDPVIRAREYKLEGNKYFRSGEFEKSIERYTAAIQECPKTEKQDLATFYQNRAAAYEQLRLDDRVVHDCTVALELNPQYLKALQRRANAFERLNKLSEALDDVTAVCLMEAFRNESSLVQADRVLKELGRQNAKGAMENKIPVLPSTTFIRAFLSSFSEDPVVKLISSIQSGSSETLSGFERAKQALANQDYSQVVPACTEEIDSVEADGQNTVGALLLRATFFMMMGEQKNALADLEAVIGNDQADVKHRVNALIKRASVHIQMADVNSCMEDFERAVTLDPTNSDIYHHRGQMKILLDQAEEAVQDFTKAVELNPDFPMAYAQKCYTDFRYKYVIARDMSSLDGILNNFHDAIKRFPNCTECYMLLAQVLSDLERYDDADKYFSKAVENDPSNPTLYVHRAILQLRWKDNTDEAVKMLNKAIKMDEKCEFAYETLGTVEVQRGRLDKAVELFDTAIPLAKSETEMAHLFSLRDAAVAQARVAARMGVTLPGRV